MGKIEEVPKLNVDVVVFNTRARHVPTKQKLGGHALACVFDYHYRKKLFPASACFNKYTKQIHHTHPRIPKIMHIK